MSTSTPTPSPCSSVLLLDYEEDEQFLLDYERDELITGADVSLAFLSDDDSNDNNNNSNDSDAVPALAEDPPAALVDADVNGAKNKDKEATVQSENDETVHEAASEPIVITISDSESDDDYSNHENSPKKATVKGGSHGSPKTTKTTLFKRPKLSRARLAAKAFNSKVEHDFELSPCFHFNFQENGCNREPTSIHGNYIKAKLHCCYECFTVAQAIAFHRRNDSKCPLRKNDS